MAKVKAFELDTEAAGYTGGDGVHFGDFPGVWEPGRPIAVSELGFDTDKQARDLVKELGLPLREVQADLADALMPERPNHASAETVLEPDKAEAKPAAEEKVAE